MVTSMMQWQGKVAVVTGAMSVPGWDCARAIAAAGAHVLLLDRDAEVIALAQELPHGAYRHQGLVLNPLSDGQREAAFAHIVMRFGCIHMLVNAGPAAASAMPGMRVHEACVYARSAVQRMRGGDHACIVNLSIGRYAFDAAQWGAHAAAQRALWSLTEGLAREWAPLGVYINLLSLRGVRQFAVRDAGMAASSLPPDWWESLMQLLDSRNKASGTHVDLDAQRDK